jgi:aminopeptidase YwaD
MNLSHLYNFKINKANTFVEKKNMGKKNVIQKATLHLHELCTVIGERRVGGIGNRKATSYVEKVLKELGWETESTSLQVIDWESEGASLTCLGDEFEVFSSPYSLGCAVSGELVAVDSMEQLEKTNFRDKILLLHGNITTEQIAPKNFPFWNPEEHQRLVAQLENGNPLALICATGHNAAIAGGTYPFPLFEDGDFHIPSVYMKDIDGVKLLSCVGKTVDLISHAKRIPETAFNLIARNNQQLKDRLVISAHIDTKINTPGAIDNGTGVTILLLLAELLRERNNNLPIELAFFNGEDYYATPGQILYLQQNEGRLGDIRLNINIDGAGYKEGLTCFSPFDLPANLATVLQEVLTESPELVEALPWYQGDHSMFLQNGCPAIAVSSQWFIEHMESQEITHTPKDNLDVVNFERVAECALGIASFIGKIEAIPKG